MTPARLTEKVVEIVALVESTKVSIDMINQLMHEHAIEISSIRQTVSIVETTKALVDRLNQQVHDHANDLVGIRSVYDNLISLMSAHIERETAHAQTLSGVVKFIVAASTVAFGTLVSGIVWLILNPNPWLND